MAKHNLTLHNNKLTRFSSHQPPSSLVGLVMEEMADMASNGKVFWLKQMLSIENLINLPNISRVGTIKTHVRSRFEQFWLDQINTVRLGSDGGNHNKLRTYSKFKGFLGTELYLLLI